MLIKLKPIYFILIVFVLWKLAVFSSLGWGSTLSKSKATEYTRLSEFVHSDNVFITQYLLPHGNFDGIPYLDIAGRGYDRSNGRFFPLYPIIIGIISFLFHASRFTISQFVIAFIVANGFFIASLYFLYKLLRLDYSERIVRSSLIFLLLFPTSFFFGNIYTESLFLFLLVLSFLFARENKWFLASCAASFATSARPIGIFLFLIFLVEFYFVEGNLFEKKKIEVLKIAKKIWPLFLIPIPFLLFVWFNFITFKDPLFFLHAQAAIGNGRTTSSFVLLPQILYRYIQILRTVSMYQYVWFVALIELLLFVLGIVFISIAWIKKVRISYVIFSILCLLIPSSTGTLNGMPRYVIIAFPIYIALSLIKNVWIKVILAVVFFALLIILTQYFSRGFFIA